MSTEQVVNQKTTIDSWQRIATELLSEAGIKINGSRPFDIQVHNPHFFKRVLQHG